MVIGEVRIHPHAMGAAPPHSRYHSREGICTVLSGCSACAEQLKSTGLGNGTKRASELCLPQVAEWEAGVGVVSAVLLGLPG